LDDRWDGYMRLGKVVGIRPDRSPAKTKTGKIYWQIKWHDERGQTRKHVLADPEIKVEPGMIFWLVDRWLRKKDPSTGRPFEQQITPELRVPTPLEVLSFRRQYG